MSRRYLTVVEFSKKYNVPISTVKTWIKNGTLNVMRSVRPMLIPDDQGTPEKDPDIHEWRYQWKR